LVVHDAVGGPPLIPLAEENGQVIAVRLYSGKEDDPEDGFEEGFDSEDDE
jgi:hypothetical protein